MKIKFILFIIFSSFLMLVHSCAPKKNSQDCNFSVNVYGQRISWKNKLPVKLFINSSVPAELRPAIYRAAQSWDLALGQKVFEISIDASGNNFTANRDQKNVIYFLQSWESDKKTEQGRTSVYWAGDEIQEADIKINAANFIYYDSNPQQLVKSYSQAKAASGFNFEALILHEMGHFLGLKHYENDGTVMAKYLTAYSDRVNVAQVDQNSVMCEYN